MNPAYGKGVEDARMAEVASNQQELRDEDSDAHWVTIDGQHILISRAQAGQTPKGNAEIRRRIADTAIKYNGNTDWAYARQKGNFPRDSNKCNQYVYDVTKEAGAEATVIGSDGKRRVPLAAEWADPNTKIENWMVLGKNERPQPGDVAAYKQPGGGVQFSGHSGIVTSTDSNGLVRAMAAHSEAVGPDDRFQLRPGVTFRRYSGGE
jgi:CHAP domain